LDQSNGATVKPFPAIGEQNPLLAGDPFATLCSPEDVNTVYKLVLGRPPESGEIVAWYTTQTLHRLVQATVSSTEFVNLIAGQEGEKQPLPQSALGREALKSAIRWLGKRLNLHPVPAVEGKAADWQDVVACFLSSWPVWKFFQDAFGSRSRIIYSELIASADRLDDKWQGQIDVANTAEIKGWVFNPSRDEIVRASFYADGIFIGMTECSTYRRDVQQHRGGNGICGFRFRPVVSHLPSGRALCRLTATVSDTGERLPIDAEFHNTGTQGLAELIAMQENLTRLSERIEELRLRLPAINCLTSFPIENYSRFCEVYGTPSPTLPGGVPLPKISVVVPIYKPSRLCLQAAIESVRNQTYANWELVLVNDAPEDTDTVTFLRQLASANKAIKVVAQETNTGLAGAINAGIEASSGDYISFLDHDDELDRNALAWCGYTIMHTGAKLIYTDEDRFQYEGDRKVHHHPFFKTAFDYDHLLQRNYICHLVCICAKTLKAVGAMRPGCDGVQDHDLCIRLAEVLEKSQIVHIPLILYHWNVNLSSYSMTEENIDAIEGRARKIVAEHLARTGREAAVSDYEDDYSPKIRFCCSVKWGESLPKKRLAIIIPTRDRVECLAPCIESIRKCVSDPGRCEIIIVNNRSEQIGTLQYLKFLEASGGVKVLSRDEDFNWSRLNNFSARETDAEHLLFMNNDMVVLTKGFDELVCGLLERQDVGVVGARLLFENGTVQHAGTAIGVNGIGAHVGVGDPAGNGVYEKIADIDRNVGAVTGAFIGVSKATFESVKGFDEDFLKVAFNDVDFCLKVRSIGKSIIYTPKITCYHYESISRGYDYADREKAARAHAEEGVVKRRWGKILDYDLYYNIVFDRYAPPYTMIRMPSGEYVSRYLAIQRDQALRDEKAASGNGQSVVEDTVAGRKLARSAAVLLGTARPLMSWMQVS
jgi:GT2 family glycosyltransferase